MSAKEGKPKIVSCAECRRLKLKCNREFPCSSCIRRGLQAICPDGSLPTRPKVLMEEAERLTQKNAQLTERMKLLEEALERKRRSQSPPKTSVEANTQTENPIPMSSVEDINDSLGTLTIDKDGHSTFLGNTAGMESIFTAQEEPTADVPTVPIPDFLHTLGIFSTLHGAQDAVLPQVEVYLPPLGIAQKLIGIYYEKAAWLFNPLPLRTLLSTLLPQIYPPNTASSPPPSISTTSPPSPANLGILFMVFAIGSLLSHAPGEGAGVGELDAETYHQLARTVLSCDPVLVNPCMENIRALMLMAYYHILRDQNAAQHVWALMGLVAHMAENIGLHRDPRQWHMDDQLVQERRTLFWEIYSLCILESISFGRPPPLPLDYCDCEYPRFSSQSPSNLFATHKYIFASTVLSQVTRATLGVRGISYGMILALDRRIRDFPPFTVDTDIPETQGRSEGSIKMQKFMGRAICEMALLYLHRRFFAKALSTYPADVLHCPYGPSVLAIFKAAATYIGLMKDFCEEKENIEVAIRYGILWNNLLASCFVMAAIVTRIPSSVLAPSAHPELITCHAILEKAAQCGGASSRPAKALEIIAKIHSNVRKATTNFHAGLVPLPSNAITSTASSKASRRSKRDEDPSILNAIDIFSGKPRLLTTRRQTPPPTQPSPMNLPGTSAAGTSQTQHENVVQRLLGRKQDDLAKAEWIYAAYKAAHPELVRVLREATKSPQPVPPNVTDLTQPLGQPSIGQPFPAELLTDQQQNPGGMANMMQQGMIDPNIITQDTTAQVQFQQQQQQQQQQQPAPMERPVPMHPQPFQSEEPPMEPMFLDFSQPFQSSTPTPLDLLKAFQAQSQSKSQQSSAHPQSPLSDSSSAQTQLLATPGLDDDLSHIFTARLWDLSPSSSDNSKSGGEYFGFVPFGSATGSGSGEVKAEDGGGGLSVTDVGLGNSVEGYMDVDVDWDQFMKQFGMQMDSKGSPSGSAGSGSV